MASSNSLDALLAEAEIQVKEFGEDSAEVIQHLRDLGYLTALPFNSVNRDKTLITALKHFEDDFIESGFFTTSEIGSLKALYGDAFADEMLRKIMDLDEGFPIPKMPEAGEISLISRLLHFRLSTYGLYQLSANHPCGFSTIMGLQSLRQFLAFYSNLDAANLLADKEGILKRVLSIYGSERCLLFLHVSDSDARTLDFNPRELRSERDFYRLLEQDFEFKPKYLAGFKRDILAQKSKDVKWEYVKGRSTDELTKFVIRVMQVHQWMDGFYDGNFDGAVGSLSLNSVATLLKFYNASAEKELKLKSILYYIGDGYFVFNALSLIKNYIIEDAPEDTNEEVINALSTQSGQLNAVDRAKFESNMNTILDSAKLELHQQKKKLKMGIGKRVYFGIRSFLKKLFRVGKRLVKMILHHLKKIFKQLTDFFKRVLEYGKKALTSFIQGIKYIIGRLPIVTENKDQFAITNTEFMGDSLSLINDQLSLKGLEQHQQKVMEVQQSAQFSVAMVGEVLKLLKFTLHGVVGWPILILQLAKATRSLYQKHQHIFQP